MLGNMGAPTLILIVIVALLLFGPSKLPELGRAMGKTLREFKNGAKDMMSDDEEQQGKQVNNSHMNATSTSNKETEQSNDQRNLPD